MLNLRGAIVSIDAMGTQKEIAQRIADKGADYVIALKGNQTSLHDDTALFFADPVRAAECAASAETDAGHGRDRGARLPGRRGKLARRTPSRLERSALHRRGRRPAHRQEDRPRKPRDPVLHHVPRTRPQAILAATHTQWGIEIFHWTLDVTFDEDRCRTRKDASPLNFAVIRHTGYNLLKSR